MRYFGTFGWYGIVLYLKLGLARKEVSVQCGSDKTDLFLRPGTSDKNVFEQIFIEHQYACPIPELRPRIIIDAGANIGLATRYFKSRFPEAKVICIEPEPGNFQQLVKNVRGLSDCLAIKGALCAPGEGDFCLQGGDAWGARVQKAGANQQTVKVVTMEELLNMIDFQAIDILKIDIEGSEKLLLADPGVKTWMPKVRMMMIELHEFLEPGTKDVLERSISGLEHTMIENGETTIVHFPGH